MYGGGRSGGGGQDGRDEGGGRLTLGKTTDWRLLVCFLNLCTPHTNSINMIPAMTKMMRRILNREELSCFIGCGF